MHGQAEASDVAPALDVPPALDAFAWTSIWLGAANVAAQAAASVAMGLSFDPLLGALAFCGTVAVYGLDHLVDREPDRQGSPLRTAFLERHARAMRIWCYTCLALALGLGSAAGLGVVALAAVALALGLLHRRLKKRAWTKPLYVTIAWTFVVVGFPAVADPAAADVALVAGVMGCTGAGNVLLYNLRPGRVLLARWGARGGRVVALLLLLVGIGLSVLGPPPVQRLIWMPLALAPMLMLRPLTERRVAWFVDGGLLVGALLSLTVPWP